MDVGPRKDRPGNRTMTKELEMRKNEKRTVRIPFAKAVLEGVVPEWVGAQVIRHVSFDRRGPRISKTDLVLLSRNKGIGIVECKLRNNRESRHGMVEQVLMYVQMARELSPCELSSRLALGESEEGFEGVNTTPFVEEIAKKEWEPKFFPILVVDQWDDTLGNTVGITLPFVNRLMHKSGLPMIEAYQICSGRVERVK